MEQKEYLLIHDLCQRGNDIIHNMCVVNTGTLSRQNNSPEKCLQTTEKDNKKKYMKYCLQKLRRFSPFIMSVDGLLGAEAETTLKLIAVHLIKKWNQTYSWTCVYSKSMVAITLVRANHHCIRGSRLPVHKISIQRPQWKDGDTLFLFR